MAVDRGRSSRRKGDCPATVRVTDGIGILVLSALAEVELDVAFHVLRRFSAGAVPCRKFWKYRQRLARTTLSASRSSGARRSLLSVLARLGRGEKVGEQLCDALGRVVMHPVRRAEQALDAVQVGHVVVVGLG